MEMTLEQIEPAIAGASARMKSIHGRTLAINARAAVRPLTAEEQSQLDGLLASFEQVETELLELQARRDAIQSTPSQAQCPG